MISMTGFLLAASLTQSPDAIFVDGYDTGYSCPATISTPNGTLSLLRVSDIWYGDLPPRPPTHPARFNVDVTEWENIWGHGTGLLSELLTLWPGVNGAGPVIRSFGRRVYIGAHFNTGTSGPPMYGFLAYATNVGGPDLDIKISRQCGDFSVNEANPACTVRAVSDDSPAIRYKFGSGNTSSYCNLQPNTDYYLNIRMHDPASPTECPVTSSVCPFYSVSNWRP
jgi:hypothetical protein